MEELEKMNYKVEKAMMILDEGKAMMRLMEEKEKTLQMEELEKMNYKVEKELIDMFVIQQTKLLIITLQKMILLLENVNIKTKD